jgi:hypothetical protein
MPAVDSSMMERVDYRDAERQLDITFASGKTYTYFGVAQRVYEGLLAAESKGRFFHDSIDGTYRYAQVRRRRSG